MSKSKQIPKSEYKLVTRFNFIPQIQPFEDMPSKTIQGEAYTIPELIKRFSMGLVDNLAQEPIYLDGGHDSLDLNKTNALDLVDKGILADENQLTLQGLIQELKLAKHTKDTQEEADRVKAQSETTPTPKPQKEPTDS